MARRLNVHLTVDLMTAGYARRLNEAIRALSDSLIVFDDASPMRPHITLVMGEAMDSEPSAAMQDALSVAVKASRATVLSLELERPYYVAGTGYVLADVAPMNTLDSLIACVRGALVPRFVQAQDREGWVPHVTFARVDPGVPAVDRHVESQHPHGPVIASAIEVSNVGPAGSCIDGLLRLPLPADMLDR